MSALGGLRVMDALPVEPLYAATHTLHLLSAALIIGFMAIVQVSVVPAQDLLDGTAYTTFEGRMNMPLQRLTPALLVTAIVSGAACAGLAAAAGAPALVVALHALATVGLVAMTVSTLVINAPVNDAINTWDPAAPPADWAQQRDRWERGHAIRVAIGVPVLLLAVVAAVLG